MLELTPIKQKEANKFVETFHRHHGKVTGSVFQIACSENNKIIGVIIVGRPVSRHLDDGWTLEVNRLCTTGEKNVCSKLYAAAWRVTKNLGYKKLITYILNTETGITPRAAGWKYIGIKGGGTWNNNSRPRIDTHPIQQKQLYATTT